MEIETLGLPGRDESFSDVSSRPFHREIVVPKITSSRKRGDHAKRGECPLTVYSSGLGTGGTCQDRVDRVAVSACNQFPRPLSSVGNSSTAKVRVRFLSRPIENASRSHRVIFRGSRWRFPDALPQPGSLHFDSRIAPSGDAAAKRQAGVRRVVRGDASWPRVLRSTAASQNLQRRRFGAPILRPEVLASFDDAEYFIQRSRHSDQPSVASVRPGASAAFVASSARVNNSRSVSSSD